MPSGFSGKREVYIEVAERYEKYIRLGILREGDRLPSVRVAANEMGVNPNTVQKAYTLLEEKGLILSLPKKGVFVKNEGTKHNDDDKHRREIFEFLNVMKDNGVSKKEIKDILEEIYHD